MTTDTPPRSSALASDFGWGDADEGSGLDGVRSAALLIASSSVYLASVWLAHGLPPFHHLALRVRGSRDPGPKLPSDQ
jgi:hypothetical protein